VFRQDFQKLSRTRLAEANVLLKRGHDSGAYYLCGVSVECAIKACIAKKVQQYEFPDKGLAQRCYDHDLSKLIGVAQLTQTLDAECAADQVFGVNWATVKDWRIENRYELSVTTKMARDLYAAVASRKHGVFRWLRQYW
jgi:HEPN domain-containing protein